VALIVFSSLPKPAPYIEFSDKLLEQGRDIFDAIYYVNSLFLEQESDVILEKLTSSHVSQNYWPCTFGEEYEYDELNEADAPTGTKIKLKRCAFVEKRDFAEKLTEVVRNLEEIQNWLTQSYLKIRRENDILDTKLTASLDYYEFHGVNDSVTTKAPTWADFVSSKINDAISKLSTQHDFKNNLAAQLDFMFVAKNRKIIEDKIKSLQEKIFEQLTANRNQELIAHLVFSIILVLLPVLLMVGFIMPALRALHQERIQLLKLLLLVPKSLVWDFVYITYKEKEENEEDGEEGNQSMTATEKLALSKAKQRKMKTEDVVDIVDDNKSKIVIYLSILLFSISIPLIAHCAWRYTDNISASANIGRYTDVLKLYYSFSALREESIGIYSPSQVAPDLFAPYFGDVKHAAEEIKEKTNEVMI
jgi:hypothetical protein